MSKMFAIVALVALMVWLPSAWGQGAKFIEISVADNGAGGNALFNIEPTHEMFSVYTIRCLDTQGCDATMNESRAIPGQVIVFVAHSANSVAVNFADTAGLTELSAGIALGANDTLTLAYAQDRWVQMSTSNN